MPHTINGSVLTSSVQNYLPIEMDYNFTRNACSLLLPFDGILDSTSFVDISPYNQSVLNRGLVKTVKGFNSLFPTCAYFDGSSDLAILNNGYFTFKGPFTIQFRMKSSVFNANNRVFQLGYESSSDGFSIISGANNATDKISIYGNGSAWRITGTISAFNNADNLITLTRDDANNMRLFVNGVQSGSTWSTSQIFGTGQSPVVIGSYYGTGNFYNGYMSELLILNGICLYSANFTPPTTKYEVRKEVTDTYSGLTIETKVGEDTTSLTPMKFDYSTRTWKRASSKDISKMPAKALAVQNSKAGENCKMLKFGSMKYIPEEIEQEYVSIVPDMSSNNPMNGYVIRRSSKYVDDGTRDHEAYLAFNNNKQKSINSGSTVWDMYWITGSGYWNELAYFTIKLDKPRIVKSYSWYPRSGDPANAATRWKLKASNDGITWVLLDLRINQTSWTAGTAKTYTINNNTAYQYYQFFDMYMVSMGELILRDENKRDIVPRIGGIVCVASASSEYSTKYPAWKAFDKTIGTNESNSWLVANNNPNTGWLKFDFGYENLPGFYEYPSIDSYSIASVYHTTTWRALSTWTFEGSNNDIDWDVLHSVINDTTSWTAPGQTVVFPLGRTVSYRYYRVNVTATRQAAGANQTYFGINNLDLLKDGVSVLPKFSGYTQSPGKYVSVSASSEYDSNYLCWKAFNRSSSSTYDPWITANGAAVCWLRIDTGPDMSYHDNTLVKYAITARNNARRGDPKSWNIQGSNDGNTWEVVDSHTNVTAWAANERREFTLSTPVKYRFYKLNINDSYFYSSVTYSSIGEFELINGSGINFIPQLSDYIGFWAYPFPYTPSQLALGVSASSEYSTSYPAWRALNKKTPLMSPNDGSNWLTTNGTLTGWVKFDWGTNVDESFRVCSPHFRSPINGYSMTTMYSPSMTSLRTPKTWIFEGSNDNINWITLHSVTNDTTSFTAKGQTVSFSLGQTVDYRYYRISVNDTNLIGTSSTYFGLFNIGLLMDGMDVSPNMTQASWSMNHYEYGPFKIHWNQSYPGWEPFRLFTKNPTTDDGWRMPYSSTNSEANANNNFGSILEVQLPAPKVVTKYGIYPCTWYYKGPGKGIWCWRLKGSNDNVNWDILDTQFNVPESKWGHPGIFYINNPKPYRYYRFDSLHSNSCYGIDLYESTRNWPLKSIYINPISKSLAGTKPTDVPTYTQQNIGNVNGKYFDTTSDVSVSFFDFSSITIQDNSNNLGDVTLTSNTNIPSIIDGPIVTAIYNSLTINNGVTLTTATRCRGLRVIVMGDCLINGTLSMTGRGANYSPPWQTDYPITDENGNILAYLPRYGSPGAPTKWCGGGTNYVKGDNGQAGVNGGCGGGGGGGAYAITYYAGGGGRGGQFSGGAGGGGCGGNNNTGNYGIPGCNEGGQGGVAYAGGRSDGTAYYAAGGAGNPGGDGFYGNSTWCGRYDGTGGILILIVYGNLIVGSTGIISADGSPAHPGSSVCLGGGGGSGGGSVNVFYRGDLTNNGSIRANGGLGTPITWNSNAVTGGNGGAGSVRIIKI